MALQFNPKNLKSNPAMYRIRVPGLLNPEWSEFLQGMTMSTVEDEDSGTCTELVGLLADQAALMGVLELLYDRGVLLLNVQCMGSKTSN